MEKEKEDMREKMERENKDLREKLAGESNLLKVIGLWNSMKSVFIQGNIDQNQNSANKRLNELAEKLAGMIKGGDMAIKDLTSRSAYLQHPKMEESDGFLNGFFPKTLIVISYSFGGLTRMLAF